MKIKKLRSAPVFQESGQARVDRDAGKIYGVSAMQVGPALGHDSYCDEKTIAAIKELADGHSKGVKVRFTHPGMCSDGLGKMLGRMDNFRVEDDKVVGDFTAGKYAKQSLVDHIFTLAEEDPQAFGMSVVIASNFAYKVDGEDVEVKYDNAGYPFVPDDVETDENGIAKLFIRPEELRAVDFVDEPAANRDGLFSEAFDGTSNQSASEAFAILDQLIDQYNLDGSQVADFVGRYFNSRTGTLPDQQPAAPAASNEESYMDIKEVHALAAKHPASADAILSLAAEGKTEAEIIAQLSELELGKAKEVAEGLRAELAEAKQINEDLVKELAEVKAAHEALAKLSNTQDPGPDGPAKKTVTEKEFNAMTGKARGEFFAAGGTIEEGAE